MPNVPYVGVVFEYHRAFESESESSFPSVFSVLNDLLSCGCVSEMTIFLAERIALELQELK